MQPPFEINTPEWVKDAAIYELNVRQFTPEGTFKAAEKHLERIKKLGPKIIWLMPIHMIGKKNRKGSLGSPYSVRDYYSINPEFGTADDLRSFIEKAHGLGLYVLLDWVANHTSWDHGWVEKHPGWYAKDHHGKPRPTPWWDWTDIIELDYSRTEMREEMIKAMKYWVKEFGMDGFRADVAGLIPLDFWIKARMELEQIKPVFMLAEWESRDMHKAFDMTYAWTWWEAIRIITAGEGDLGKLFKYYSWHQKTYPPASIRMTFLTNHDINSWNGSMFNHFGDFTKTAAALSVVGEGMPLIYNGQEAGNEKMLPFFEKDNIEWREHEIGELYKNLLALKKRNSALWNGKWGAGMIKIPNNHPNYVLSFIRKNEENAVLGIFNFSKENVIVKLQDSYCFGSYQDYLKKETVQINQTSKIGLEKAAFTILVQ